LVIYNEEDTEGVEFFVQTKVKLLKKPSEVPIYSAWPSAETCWRREIPGHEKYYTLIMSMWMTE